MAGAGRRVCVAQFGAPHGVRGIEPIEPLRMRERVARALERSVRAMGRGEELSDVAQRVAKEVTPPKTVERQ